MAITADWFVNTVSGSASAAGTSVDPYDGLANLFANETIAAGDIIAAYSNGATNPEQKGSALAIGATNGAYYNPIAVVGVNSSYENDGTLYVIDGENGAYHCVTTAQDYWIFENVHFYNSGSTYNGMNIPTASDNNAFINCKFTGCGGDGCYCTSSYTKWILCEFSDNSGVGLNMQQYYNNFLFCSAHDNGSNGISFNYGIALGYGSISKNNGGAGIGPLGQRCYLINCTVNGNTGDGFLFGTNTNQGVYIANRSTNNIQEGFDYGNAGILHGWNYVDGNSSNTWSGSGEYEITDKGTGTDILGGGDTDDGYTDLTADAEDFNLVSDASLRRTEIKLWPGR